MDKRAVWAGVLAVGFALLLVACTGDRLSSPTAAPATDQQASGRALIVQQGKFFSAAGNCAGCHTGLKDQSGADVSIDLAWRATMMANAARDPYYRAKVRSEILPYAEEREALESKCSTCHTPMAHVTALAAGQSSQMLDAGFFAAENPLHLLAIDGVSCSHCHQVQADNLGKEDSLSGGYKVDLQTTMGQRAAYGPFPVDPNLATIMQGASGFAPQQSPHLGQAEFCAVCHTLYTNYFEADGTLSKETFPEQTPYLEWKHSRYAGQTTCQGCHMPAAAAAARIANTGGQPRSPFSQHQFVGGNVLMAGVLQKNGEALQVTAEDAQFAQVGQRTRQQLAERTVKLDVQASRDGQDVLLRVQVDSLVGHKFPSGFPSRRAWLHVVVRDAQGKTIFESGAWQENGAIVGNENDADPARYEPHYSAISAPDQVQIYETILAASDGSLTTTLMRAARYLKDNRLLPAGFDKTSAPPDVAVAGAAFEDVDFTAGKDEVVYRVPGAAGPLRVEVEMLYQTIGYRWLENLREDGNAEAEKLFAYLQGAPDRIVSIASQQVELP